MHLVKTSSLTSVAVALAVGAPSLASSVASTGLPEQAFRSIPASNSTFHHPTLSQVQKEAAPTFYPAEARGHPPTGSTSQATRIADSKAGKMSGVVAGLCIAAGVAGVAGGLGLGMGLEEEKTVENDESST